MHCVTLKRCELRLRFVSVNISTFRLAVIISLHCELCALVGSSHLLHIYYSLGVIICFIFENRMVVFGVGLLQLLGIKSTSFT